MIQNSWHSNINGNNYDQFLSTAAEQAADACTACPQETSKRPAKRWSRPAKRRAQETSSTQATWGSVATTPTNKCDEFDQPICYLCTTTATMNQQERFQPAARQ